MNTCPVCQSSNHHLAITCTECGSYIQRRVDNLDLFSTLWKVIEAPRMAFYSIVIAVHKNYVLFLSAIAGFWVTFSLFRLAEVGEATNQFISILAAGLALGPFLGIAVSCVIAVLLKISIGVFQDKAKMRNILALTAYAQTPVVFLSIFLLPLELMTWGRFFFTRTPTADQLYPTSFWIVSIFTGIGLLWTILLFFIGLKELLNTSRIKTFFIGFSTLLLFIPVAFGGIFLFKHF